MIRLTIDQITELIEYFQDKIQEPTETKKWLDVTETREEVENILNK